MNWKPYPQFRPPFHTPVLVSNGNSVAHACLITVDPSAWITVSGEKLVSFVVTHWAQPELPPADDGLVRCAELRELLADAQMAHTKTITELADMNRQYTAERTNREAWQRQADDFRAKLSALEEKYKAREAVIADYGKDNFALTAQLNQAKSREESLSQQLAEITKSRDSWKTAALNGLKHFHELQALIK